MGRYATDSGGNFEQAPTGTHVGICYRLIDLGTQHGEYQGKPNARNQVLVSWELPNELMKDGQPFVVSKFYTNSLGEKANLRQHLESWRGQHFTVEELKKFDLQNILGKPCLLSIIHNDKERAVVSGVMAMPKGSAAPEMHNKPFVFWIDEWNQESFDSLSDGIKDIIKESDEYKARVNPSDDGGLGAMPNDLPWDNDDIPF